MQGSLDFNYFCIALKWC